MTEKQYLPTTTIEGDDKYPDIIITCQKTGNCCFRDPLDIFKEDLYHWFKDEVIFDILPHLDIDIGENNEVRMRIKKEVKAACPFLESRECSIYQNRPLTCRAFPVEFDGEGYFISDEACPGVGIGERENRTREHYGMDSTILHYESITGLHPQNILFLKNLVKNREELLNDKEKRARFLEKGKYYMGR